MCTCGMSETDVPKFHPYAACLMFMATHNGATVEANLRGVVEYGMRAQANGVSLDEAMTNISSVLKEREF